MMNWLRRCWCLWVHGREWYPLRASRTRLSLDVTCQRCRRRWLYHREDGFAIPWQPSHERFFEGRTGVEPRA